MRGWWLRLRRLLRWGTSEREIRNELRFHLEMEAEANRRRGMDPAEARRRARIAFGGEERWREEVRSARGTAWLEDAVRDVRHTLRELARSPGFAAAAIGTIALGVGAPTAIYSVVDQVVLSPLPYPDAEAMVSVWTRNPERGIEKGMASWPDFADWRRSASTFDGLATVVPERRTLTGDGGPEQLPGASVSAGFFELIGVPLALGRSFRPEEVERAEASVVVLSHELFVRRFGGDPSVVGRTLQLDDASYEVVGVAAPGGGYPRAADFWLPQAFGHGREWRDPRNRHWLTVVGRLAEGATLLGASRDMQAVAAGLEAAHPQTNAGVGVTLEPLREAVTGEARTPLLVLLGAVVVVMLIAVVNVANLLLARGAARAAELAARLALGAGRGRVIRQVLTGSAVLGFAGGLLGTGVAWAGVVALVQMAPGDLPRLDEVGVDPSILTLALSLALGASLVFGLAPALQATRVAPGSSLRPGARGAHGSGSRASGRLRGALVGGQFALAFVLLIGAGLLARSFLNLRSVDPGFEPAGVLSVGLTLPPGRYGDAETRAAFHRALIRRLERRSEVEAVGVASTFLLAARPHTGTVTVEGRSTPVEAGTEVPVVGDVVSPGFFQAAGMRLVAGRGIEASDGPEDVPVAVVNETFARLHAEGMDPVGRRITWGEPHGDDTRWFTIVGVVGDARRSGLDAPVRAAVYQAAGQSPPREMELLVRTGGAPAELGPVVQEVVHALDPDLPLLEMQTLERRVGAGLAQRRFVTWILGVFALGALALAAIGIFGVMAYVVARRTREIGVRMALGADRAEVVAEVLRDGLAWAGGGLAVGALAALALSGVVRSQLYGLGATDPVTFIGAAAVLLGVAGAACLLPARRAASVEAVEALRGD